MDVEASGAFVGNPVNEDAVLLGYGLYRIGHRATRLVQEGKGIRKNKDTQLNAVSACHFSRIRQFLDFPAHPATIPCLPVPVIY